MKLTTLSEVVTAHSALTVLLHKTHSLTQLYRDMVHDSDRWFGDHEMRFVKRLLGTKKAKWFVENYLGGNRQRGYGLKDALFELSRTIHDDILDKLATLPVMMYKSEALQPSERTSANFKQLEVGMPHVLAKIASQFRREDLAHSVKSLEAAMRAFETHLSELEAKEQQQDAPDEEEKPENLLGQQAAAAEQAVNAVLMRVPANVRGDIRNAIARSPNKLQALQHELTQRGIKLAEGYADTVDLHRKRIKMLCVEIGRTLARMGLEHSNEEWQRHNLDVLGDGGNEHDAKDHAAKTIIEQELDDIVVAVREEAYKELVHGQK